MTPDLTWLAYTAALTAILWVPYIVGMVIANGMITAQQYKDPTPPELPAWVKRCNRAHINAVESIAPFAVMVLIAHVSGAANETTAMWAMVFFFARLAHAIVYWLGIPFLRTGAFAVGLLATLLIFYEVISYTPAS